MPDRVIDNPIVNSPYRPMSATDHSGRAPRSAPRAYRGQKFSAPGRRRLGYLLGPPGGETGSTVRPDQIGYGKPGAATTTTRRST